MFKRCAFWVGLVASSHALFAATPPAIPLAFETNQGQAPAEVRYLARTKSGTVAFRTDAVTLPCETGKSPVELLLPRAQVVAETPTGGIANYYAGTDRKRWVEGAPLVERVRYNGVAPGIDLLFRGYNGELEYDIEVSSNADPDAFHLRASRDAAFRIDPDGAARLGHAGGCDGLRLLAPVAFQKHNGVRTEVTSRFALDARGDLTVRVGNYDHSLPLTIDPVVSFTKVIGADNSVTVSGLATDAAGDIIVTGYTYATNWPVVNGQSGKASAGNQPFLTKLDPTGTQILYSTYLPITNGGSSSAVTVDTQGNAYIVGIASGTDLAVTSTNLGTCSSSFCNGGFAAKFNSTGSLVYATYLGTGQQLPEAIAVDKAGSLYIGGLTADAGLMTVNAFQTTYSSGVCTSCAGAFFGKLTPDGANWVYSSYFNAGSSYPVETYISALTLDTTGNLYIAGSGSAVPLKSSLMAGTGSAFAAELGPDGRTLLWSSILGGTIHSGTGDSVNALSVGNDGTVFLAGSTTAEDFPFTVAAMRHPTYSQNARLYAAAMNPARSAFSWATYLGQGQVTSSTTDAAGNLYLGGKFSNGTMLYKNAVASDQGSGAYILELDPKGNLLQATAFGGRDTYQVPSGMATDPSGNLDIAGIPNNQFLSGALLDPINIGTASFSDQQFLGQNTSFIGYSGFIAQIAPATAPQISLSYSKSPVELRNAGSADLHISSIQGNAGTVQSNCGSVVAAGTACYILPGTSSALTINSDANPASQTYTLPSTATSYTTTVLNTSQLYLPPTANGTTSAPRPLSITNVSASPITISKILTFDSYSQTTNCVGALAPLATCTAQISVTPPTGSTSAGSGDVGILYSNGDRDDVFVSFTQNLTDGPLLLSVDSYGLQYGDVFLGTTSVVRSITVTNTETSPVAVNAPSITGTGSSAFTVSSSTCDGVTLQPQANCTIGFVFTPTTVGRLAVPLNISGGGSSITPYLVGTGVSAPAFSLTPSAIDFGSVTTGSNTTQTLTLTNSGTTALTLTNIDAALNGGDAAGDYNQTNNCGSTLPAKAFCSITVTFAPSALGTRAGQASVLVNTGYGTQTSSLTGVGTSPFAVAPSSVSFGQVAVGSSATASITLQNVTNTAEAFTLSQLSAPFRLDATGCASPLAANTGCKLAVVFTPTVQSAQNAILQVGFNGSLSTPIAITGSGTAATATISPSSYDFGSVLQGTSVNTSFTLTNTGNAPLTSIALAVSGANAADFASSTGCGTSLAAGAGCTIHINFAPSTASSESATVTVSSNADNGPQVVQLTGAGTKATAVLSASSYDFGSVPRGSTVSNSFTLTNSGDAPLRGLAVAIMGANTTDFTSGGSCGTSLSAGASCTIAIAFKPSSIARETATVTVSGNAQNGPQTLQLAGTGVLATYTVTPASSSATVSSGGATTYLLTIESDPGDTGAVTLGCTGLPASASCAFNPTTTSLPAGGMSTLTLSTIATTTASIDLRHLVVELCGLGVLPFVLLPAVGRRRYRLLPMLLLSVVLISAAGCGGSSTGGSSATTTSKTATGTYSFNVTATNGTDVKTIQLTLSVQ